MMLNKVSNSEWYFPTSFSYWGDEEYAAIDRVISSRQFTMGPEVKAFETEFAYAHDMKHGIMVNSGSSANLVSVAALVECDYVHPGERVAVPAIAWATTYAPLIQHGLELILIDCDETWNATMQGIACADMIVGCSILGNPGYLSETADYAEHAGIVLMEDNAESLGASTANWKQCGTQGLVNTFSFFYSHQISAIEGGMILTNDDELARTCRILRAHGWSRDVQKPESFSEEYSFELFGYNVRPTEIHAAVAREQLKKLKSFIHERVVNLHMFENLTDGLPITKQQKNGSRSPFGFAFTVNGGQGARSKLVAALRDNGIDVRLPTGGSFGRHSYGYRWRHHKTPNADKIHDTGLFLGLAPFPIPEKIEAAVKVMKQVL